MRPFSLLTLSAALCVLAGFTATQAYAGPITSGIKVTGKPADAGPPPIPPGQDKDKGGGGSGGSGGSGGGVGSGGSGGSGGGGGVGSGGSGGSGGSSGSGGSGSSGGSGGSGGAGGGGGAAGGAACGAGCLDLTSKGASGTLGGALFKQIDPQPTGTGKIDPFLRLQATGAHKEIQEGYSTSYRPFEFDEKNPIGFTHDLLLSDVGVFTIDGVKYREFLLDINEDSGHDDEFISLDKLMIFESATGMRHGFPDLGTLVYDLDGGGVDRWVKLDYSLGHGSGSGDMAVYIRDDLFHGLDYVYLYSRFGDHDSISAGFEEWWTREGEQKTVPEPSVLLMLGAGVASVMARRRSRKV